MRVTQTLLASADLNILRNGEQKKKIRYQEFCQVVRELHDTVLIFGLDYFALSVRVSYGFAVRILSSLHKQ